MINKTWSYLAALSPLRLGLLIFLVSFSIRLVIIAVIHSHLDLARYELERTAISLATTGVYGNPYAVPSGPTAHVSPGYPLILAAIFRFFGTGAAAETVKELVASLVTSLQYALLPWAAKSLQLDRRTALVGGLICALYPAKPLVEIEGDWETPYTALFLLVVTALSAHAWMSQETRLSVALRNGLLWGVTLLFASVLLPVFLVSLLVGLYFYWNRTKSYWRFAAVQLLVAVVCLAPWAIRNKLALGKYIFTRSNLGMELQVSNNDFASSDQRENYLNGTYARFHPLLNPLLAEQVKKLGEVEYNRRAMIGARSWIQSHQQRYFSLTLGRIRDFWFYRDPNSFIKTAFLAVTGLLGLLGCVQLLASRPASGLAIAIAYLLYPAPCYLIHVGLRQRYPLDALLVLTSAVLVFAMLNAWQARRRTSNTNQVVPART